MGASPPRPQAPARPCRPPTPPPRRWLKLRTPYGENVLVLEGQTSDFSGIHSGDNVAIAGVWLSRGAGGVRAVSGYTRAESTYCFVGTGLQKVTSAARHAAKPMVAGERRRARGKGWRGAS